WEMRGVPVRIEIGPRDLAARNATLVRRDRVGKEAKTAAPLVTIVEHVITLLDDVQREMYKQAREAMRSNTHQFDDYAKLRAHMQGEGGGGFADIYWCMRAECETKIRGETRATCRANPLNQKVPPGRCVVCGEPARERAFFAKAY